MIGAISMIFMGNGDSHKLNSTEWVHINLWIAIKDNPSPGLCLKEWPIPGLCLKVDPSDLVENTVIKVH